MYNKKKTCHRLSNITKQYLRFMEETYAMERNNSDISKKIKVI